MNTIMNNAMSAVICAYDYQQSGFYLQQEDESSVLLHTDIKAIVQLLINGERI